MVAVADARPECEASTPCDTRVASFAAKTPAVLRHEAHSGAPRARRTGPDRQCRMGLAMRHDDSLSLRERASVFYTSGRGGHAPCQLVWQVKEFRGL